jgi:hypothetical protein
MQLHLFAFWFVNYNLVKYKIMIIILKLSESVTVTIERKFSSGKKFKHSSYCSLIANNTNFKLFLTNTNVTSRSLNTSWSIFIEQLVNPVVKRIISIMHMKTIYSFLISWINAITFICFLICKLQFGQI